MTITAARVPCHEAPSRSDAERSGGASNDPAALAPVLRIDRGTSSLDAQPETRDVGVFEALLRTHADAVYGYLVRWLGDRAQADDLFQEAATRAFDNFHQLRDLGSFRTWLIQIATNHYRRTLRAARQRETRERVWHEARASHGACVEARTSAATLLQRGFERLKAGDRQILLLRFVEGMSHAKIADVLQLPEAVVKMRVSRARRRFASASDA